MKKYLLMLFGFVSFLGINTVKADTYVASEVFTNIEEDISFMNSHVDNINYLIDMWDTNHTSINPYYFINYGSYLYSDGKTYSTIQLISSNFTEFVFESGYFKLYSSDSYVCYQYDERTNEYVLSDSCSPIFSIKTSFNYLYSNYNYTFKYKEYSYSQGGTLYTEKFEHIQFPSYTSSDISFSITEFDISDGDVIPTLKNLYDGSYSSLNNNYIDINLNDYSYVALGLKDYNTIPDNNNTVYSNIYVKGQLCITPVYNYGMTERKDILTGTQVQGCSQYYNDFALTRMYILKDDVVNHAIYYIKAYDTSKDNIIKIDKSIFNVSYITEANKDNPQVNINGKIYPTLSYDSLTDTSTKSEEEGYVSGVSCAVGDFNCYNKYNPGNIFNDLFDKPLDMLKSVWGAIISIFELITEFILLLPPTMQGFLYVAFAISIILGIIKIIL